MLFVVGIGPGEKEKMTLEALYAIERSQLVAGYTVYTDIIRKIYPEKEYYSTGMRSESERVRYSLEKSLECDVSLVCSGDCSVYAMASLCFEIAEKEFPAAEIECVAGVTAALSGGAVIGAPLTNDFAVISLSDLLTPMEKIEKRLKAAAEGDFVTAIYNPSSKKRSDHLKHACDIMLEYRPPETVCGYVRNIGRDGECSEICTLAELRERTVDMFTTVFIGNSDTKVIMNRMVTPRGYRK